MHRLRHSPVQSTITLKPRFGVIQSHWKWRIWLPISVQ